MTCRQFIWTEFVLYSDRYCSYSLGKWLSCILSQPQFPVSGVYLLLPACHEHPCSFWEMFLLSGNSYTAIFMEQINQTLLETEGKQDTNRSIPDYKLGQNQQLCGKLGENLLFRSVFWKDLQVCSVLLCERRGTIFPGETKIFADRLLFCCSPNYLFFFTNFHALSNLEYVFWNLKEFVLLACYG